MEAGGGQRGQSGVVVEHPGDSPHLRLAAAEVLGGGAAVPGHAPLHVLAGLAALLPDQPVAGGARPRAQQRECRPPRLLNQRQPGRDGAEAEGAGVALVRRAAVLAGQLDRRRLEAEAE